MSLHEKIEQDLVAAMKGKEVIKLSVLRMLKAAMNNSAIEKKKDKLADPETLEVIQKQVKQRKESIESFEKGGRPELANNEKKELEVLSAYMPAQLSDAELLKIAQDVIARTGAKTKAETGKVMKDLMPLIKGKADGSRAQEVLAKLLV